MVNGESGVNGRMQHATYVEPLRKLGIGSVISLYQNMEGSVSGVMWSTATIAILPVAKIYVSL